MKICAMIPSMTRGQKMIIGFVIASAVVAGFFVWQDYSREKEPDQEVKVSTDSAVDTKVEDIKAAIKAVESERPPGIAENPTEEGIYTNPFVMHIRTAFKNYLAGSTDGVEDWKANTAGEQTCGLGSFDKALYKNKFVVLNAYKNDYGGVQADIVFVDKPDALFWAWVYQYGNESGEYTLRAFCENGPRDDKKAEFSKMMRDLLQGDYRSL